MRARLLFSFSFFPSIRCANPDPSQMKVENNSHRFAPGVSAELRTFYSHPEVAWGLRRSPGSDLQSQEEAAHAPLKKNIKNVPANACNKCKQTCTHKALMDQASSLITERLCAAGDSFAV